MLFTVHRILASVVDPTPDRSSYLRCAVGVPNGPDECGGIANRATATLSHSTAGGNTSVVGGGIINHGTVQLTQSRVNNSITEFNGSTAGTGGGIQNGGPLTLTDSAVDHSTSGDGGGILNTSTVTLTRSRVFADTPNNCAPPGSVPGCSG